MSLLSREGLLFAVPVRERFYLLEKGWRLNPRALGAGVPLPLFVTAQQCGGGNFDVRGATEGAPEPAARGAQEGAGRRRTDGLGA